jgi:hypothetical protein
MPSPRQVPLDKIDKWTPSERQLPPPRAEIITTGSFVGRTPPHSMEAEEYLISCCLLDGSDTIAKCIDGHLSPAAFYFPPNRIIFEKLVEMHLSKKPAGIEILIEELREAHQLDAVGGVPYLIQVSSRIGTTVQAQYFIAKVRQLYQIREAIKIATSTVEQCFGWDGQDDAFLGNAQQQFASLAQLNGVKRPDPVGLFDFELPPDGDRSILVGNRYLNRGDGGVLVGTSGIGKSSIEKQMAALWALNRNAFGMQSNGPLTSLMVQAEDSPGDIAEVATSLRFGLNLSESDAKLVNQRVRIHTDRKNRGEKFLLNLRHLIEDHRPDLVWINPLQAFMDGDVTQAADLGKFLREGLNGINDPPAFGYILVHHTTKPATGKDRAERLWHEVMYDMAGGAEIINWARFIMSLRPAVDKGNFNLVLAKRGMRAGVTKRVEAGAGWRDEPVDTIPLKHSKSLIEIPGRKRKLPAIFWELRDADPPPVEDHSEAPRKGREVTESFAVYRPFFPKPGQPAADLNTIQKAANGTKPISRGKLYEAIQGWISMGLVLFIPATGQSGTAMYTLAPFAELPKEKAQVRTPEPELPEEATDNLPFG